MHYKIKVIFEESYSDVDSAFEGLTKAIGKLEEQGFTIKNVGKTGYKLVRENEVARIKIERKKDK